MQVQEKMGETAKNLILIWVTYLLAAPLACAGCFDFSTRISDPLHAPVTANQSGKLPKGYDWAAVTGTVNQPIEAVLKDLIAHGTTKSSRVNKMNIKNLDDPRYLAKQEVQFEVDPFPFVSVKWKEIWAFNLTQGPAEHPEKIVISYEKVEGTSHIEHLCGNYVLERAPDNKTGVSIYEEGKSTGRSEKDTLDGLKGNLRGLGQLKGK